MKTKLINTVLLLTLSLFWLYPDWHGWMFALYSVLAYAVCVFLRGRVPALLVLCAAGAGFAFLRFPLFVCFFPATLFALALRETLRAEETLPLREDRFFLVSVGLFGLSALFLPCFTLFSSQSFYIENLLRNRYFWALLLPPALFAFAAFRLFRQEKETRAASVKKPPTRGTKLKILAAVLFLFLFGELLFAAKGFFEAKLCALAPLFCAWYAATDEAAAALFPKRPAGKLSPDPAGSR